MKAPKKTSSLDFEENKSDLGFPNKLNVLIPF